MKTISIKQTQENHLTIIRGKVIKIKKLYSNSHHEKNEKPSHTMGENICHKYN